MAKAIEEEVIPIGRIQGRHIKKRALKNKALAVNFNEKDLRDYVNGFHKRKKKRRKEAEKKQEEALRKKRIELRKKRKLEKEMVAYGGAPPVDGLAPDENDEYQEEDEEKEPIASISGMTTYDDGSMKVTVTTSEISREEEIVPSDKTEAAVPRSTGADKKHNVPVIKKKAFKRVAKSKSRPKPQNKRDKKKGKKRNKKTR
uniref:Ribosomal RNA-processing protein 17 n=1 Tax=Fagus sylvatica TaxID=28930 RepID=A0A2N9GFF5_FAGSY